MKKLIVLLALGFVGLISAKDSEIKLSFKEKKITSKILYRYAYLYQSTCGWTFNMYTETSLGLMTNDQYDDYIDELISKNEYICKLYGNKPTEGFAFKQKNSNEVRKEKI
jgi:hypothetical protein